MSTLEFVGESVSFSIAGVPAPQGSKAKWGGETNPRTGPWRAAVAAEGAAAMGGRDLLAGPVNLTVQFVFPRPKAHYKGLLLRETAPFWMSNKPDLDKLVRAIGDALTGTVLRDDSSIASLEVWKEYGESAKAVVTVRSLTTWPHLAAIFAPPAP